MTEGPPRPVTWGQPPPSPFLPPPPPRRSRKRLWGGGAAGLVIVLGAGAAALSAPSKPTAVSQTGAATPAPTASAEPTDEPSAEPTVEAQAVNAVTAALASLQVADSSSAAPYDRTAFGAAWTDTDKNGCDTRNDVLRRDLTQPVLKPGTNDCVVLGGSLVDPYSGATIAFKKGSSTIEIDHVVALGNAWESGASSWPYAKLLAFANDPLELLAVDGSLNDAKGDSDASGWLPPQGACDYVSRQVAVKSKYGLSITQAEHDAMDQALQSCTDPTLPSGGNPTLAPNRSPAPKAPTPTAAAVQPLVSEPTTAAAGDPDYGTCKNAKAHGAGPYYAGKDPEYDYYQDRDHDGVVCE